MSEAEPRADLVAAEVPEPDRLVDAVVQALSSALADRPSAEFAELGPSTELAALTKARLGAHLRMILTNDPAVRHRHDAEAVHQMRVATRRLRADLRVMHPLLDARWADDLRSELAWLGSSLGPVRDADVLAEVLADRAGALAAVDRAAVVRLLARLAEQRHDQRAALISVLRSERYLALLHQLVDASSAPLITPGSGARRAAKLLRPLAARPFRKLADMVAELDSDPSPDELHVLRIKGKRARYAADTLAQVSGGDVGRLAYRLGQLQDALGDQHDLEVAQAWLRSQVTPAPSTSAADGAAAGAVGTDATVAFSAGQLAGVLRAEQIATAEDWRAAWRAAQRAARKAHFAARR